MPAMEPPAMEPPESIVEIIPPGGPVTRADRRRASTLRPYSPLDGRPAAMPGVTANRRRRRRAVDDGSRGRCLNVES
jgi:hypothetical protein